MSGQDRLPLLAALEEKQGNPIIAYVTGDRPPADAQIGDDAVRPIHDQLTLETHLEQTGDWTGWRIWLRTGVRELGRTGIELNAEAGGYDESTQRELMNSKDADVEDTSRMLIRRASGILGDAADSEARLVQELMEAAKLGCWLPILVMVTCDSSSAWQRASELAGPRPAFCTA